MVAVKGSESTERYAGLKNNATTCYLNCLLQTLFMTPEFRNRIYKWRYSGCSTEKWKSIPYQLQHIFLKLQTSNGLCVETADLTKSFGWKSSEVSDQHDIEELCRIMFSALEKRLSGSSDASLIKDLYEGELLDFVKCEQCDKGSSRTEIFLDLPLPIKTPISSLQCRSLEEAVSNFCKPETLDSENRIYCPTCKCRQKATKGLKLLKLPYIFVVQLNRMEYNPMTRKRVKLNDYVEFPELLNLNGFCESRTPNDGTLSPREMAYFQKRFPNSSPETISKYLKEGPYVYELFSVIAHTGTAEGGHYFAYIKNLDLGEWVCFNDEEVSPASIENVKRTFGDPKIVPNASLGSASFATAYMFFYRLCNEKRNERFMNEASFPPHVQLLYKEAKLNKFPPFAEQRIEIPIYICNAVTGKVEKVCMLDYKPRSAAIDMIDNLNEKLNLKAALCDCGKQCRVVRYDSENGGLLDSVDSIGDELNPGDELYLEMLPETDEPKIVYTYDGVTMRLFLVDCSEWTVSCFGLVWLDKLTTVGELQTKLSKIMRCRVENIVIVLVYLGKTLKVLDVKSKELLAEASVDKFDVYFSVETNPIAAKDVTNEFEKSSMYEMVTLYMNLIYLQVDLLSTVFYSTRRKSLIGQVTNPLKTALEGKLGDALELLSIDLTPGVAEKPNENDKGLSCFVKSEKLAPFEILSSDVHLDPKRVFIRLDRRLKLSDFKGFLKQKLGIDFFRAYKCLKGKRYLWRRDNDTIQSVAGYDKVEIDEEEEIEDKDSHLMSVLIRMFWKGVTNQLPTFRFKIPYGTTLKAAKQDIVQFIKDRYNINLSYKTLRMRISLPGRLAVLSEDTATDRLKDIKQLWIEILPDGMNITDRFSVYTRQWYPSKLVCGPIAELSLRKPYTQGELLNKISTVFDIPPEDIEISELVEDKYFPFETSKLDLMEKTRFYRLDPQQPISQEPLKLLEEGRLIYVRNTKEKQVRISWRKREDLLKEENLIQTSNPTYENRRQRTLRINSLLSSSIADDDPDA